MNNLLAIDIHDDCISGVLLEYVQKTTVVRGYAIHAAATEGSLSEALVSIVQQTGYKQGIIRVAIGAEKFFFRNIALPFVDSKKIEKILPFELEEQTSYPIDNLHLDYLQGLSHQGGTDIFAAMINKGIFVDTLAQLAEEELDPEMVTISGLQVASALGAMGPERETFVLLDVSFHQATLILFDAGQIVLVRSLSVDSEGLAGVELSCDDAKITVKKPEQVSEVVGQLDLLLQQTLVSIGRAKLINKATPCFINGSVGLHAIVFDQLKKKLPLDVLDCKINKQPLLKIEPSESLPWNPALMNRALALGLWKKQDCAIVNFRKGAYKKGPSLALIRKRMMTFAVPLAGLCVITIGMMGWEFSTLAGKRDAIQNEVEKHFREALPEVTRIVNPVQQLKVRINETTGSGSISPSQGSDAHKLMLLAELSSRIPSSMSVEITRLVVDQNDLRIKAETKAFNTVDNVKRELEKSELFKNVEISSANLAPRGGEVRFELKMEFN